MFIFGNNLSDLVMILASVIFFGISANFLAVIISKKLNLIDYPKKGILKIQKKPTPLSGGIAIFLTLTTEVLLLNFLTVNIFDFSKVIFILFILFFVLVVGIFDDLYQLPAKIRLLFYLLFSGLFFYIFRVYLPFDIILIIFIFFICASGIVASINLIDGMDGICAGLLIISLIGFLLLGIQSQPNNILLVILSFAGILAIFPFLLFNFNPAKVFLGNSGSELLGFFLLLIILISMKDAPKYFLLLRIVLVGIPIFDLIRVIIIRLKNKKPLMVGDRNHIYDALHKKGLSQRKVWLVLMAGQIIIVAAVLIINKILLA